MPDANTVAIGATGNDAGGMAAGHARVFTWDGVAWVQKGQSLNGLGVIDNFGWRVDMPDAHTTDTHSACGPFTWINGTTYTDSDSTSTFILTNAGGCDSVVTLHLTLTEVDTAVSIDLPNLTALATGGAFQWICCDSAFLPIDGATDPVFTPTANGDYAVVVIQNGCIDTSACFSVTRVSLAGNVFPAPVWVFPNPTEGRVRMASVEEYPVVDVSVRNTMGQLIQRYTLDGNEGWEMNLDGPPGVYALEISIPGGARVVTRVVKR